MSKPPKSPPSSDIGGVSRDRKSRSAPETTGQAARDQAIAEDRDSKGRPDNGQAPAGNERPAPGV